MRTLVESFKRLYQRKRLTKAQMKVRVERGTITEDEYAYITGEVFPKTAEGE